MPGPFFCVSTQMGRLRYSMWPDDPLKAAPKDQRFLEIYDLAGLKDATTGATPTLTACANGYGQGMRLGKRITVPDDRKPRT